MASFSRERLEGRALEHALAGDARQSVRMYDDRQDKWVAVSTDSAKAALRLMRARVATLLPELRAAGLSVLGADCPVTVDGTRHSVDLRVRVMDKRADCLMEVKWSRKSLDVALGDAKKSWSWQRRACQGGRWLARGSLKPGKPIQAAAVGAVAVGPAAWKEPWGISAGTREQGECEGWGPGARPTS